MWQLVPWVRRQGIRRQAADQALRAARERQHAEHAAAVQRILDQVHSR